MSPFEVEEAEKLPARLDAAVEIIKSFCWAGVHITMNQYNKKE